MRTILAILAILLLMPQDAQSQIIFEDPELLKRGNSWYKSNCIRGSNFYFAYLQREPQFLKDNPSVRIKIENLIASCTPDKFYASIGSKSDETRSTTKRCNAYAGVAVGQYIASKNTGCDDGQGGWSNDYKGHYNWCLQQNPAVVRSEVRRRQDYLYQCAP